jgi:hypothetical protein
VGQEIEMKNLKEKAQGNYLDYIRSQNSEKNVVKSSSDTRFVNRSEEHDQKFQLVEENESKTENEFVFSENVNIDNLSYNEPIIESLKKKQEEEPLNR